MERDLQFSGCTISANQCKCFEKLTEEELELLEKNSVKVKYKRGEILFKQGGLVSQIMYMEQGLAKVYLDNGKNSLVLKIIPDGNFLGLASVSEENNTYQYSVMTYVDSLVRQIDISFFRKLLNQNPGFTKEVIDILSTNSVLIYGRFFCLTHKQAYGKLADILLCITDQIFKTREFDLPLSRKELAELSGMSAETVVRMLKKFHEEGLIQMKGKSFKVLNYERLKMISETG
ncbi:MAG: Crp/Fnr family transcriptional regulator [Mariniphaga sp.]|nr:Crp/Fnr family transcriptional regulator [Mariniphaga sp.]